MTRRKPEERRTLGVIERHRVERWITARLCDALWRAKETYRADPHPHVATAHELAAMLRQFQERNE